MLRKGYKKLYEMGHFDFLCFALCVAAVFGAGKPQQFPSKQINIVAGGLAGGTSDIVTRALAKQVEAALGVPVVVTNKPGGSSAVAVEYMAAQAPDGYNLMYMPVENAMIKALGLSQLEPKDIRCFARAMTLPATVTVKADTPWNSFEELITYAKANPGKLTAGNSGPGSIWHFAAAGIQQATGVQFNHVSFDWWDRCGYRGYGRPCGYSAGSPRRSKGRCGKWKT